MVAFLVLASILVGVHSQCDTGYTYFEGSCYKLNNVPYSRGTYDETRRRCQSEGADLASGATKSERNFISQTANLPSVGYNYNEMMILGIYRDPWGVRNYAWNTIYNETIDYVFCAGEPNQFQAAEFCMVLWYMKEVGPCMIDGRCDGAYDNNSGYSRYVCKKKTNIVCGPNAEVVNGKCACKAGYLDAVNAQFKGSHELKRGEKCISKTPCADVKDEMSILFIVDSSSSIGEQDWQNMVEFLKSGKNFIPSSARVGFVKFATNVTYSHWLRSGWDERDYSKAVPYRYDNGQTNTPAALSEAYKMFKSDRNQNQVAVLITDGEPFTDEMQSRDDGMAESKGAARKLTNMGVRLIALAFGQNVASYANDMRGWLDDPMDDFFYFDKMASDLKQLHMQVLIRAVCTNFK